jgi:RNA polymerase sigma-70 factor (ECF subfamily)
LLEPYWEVVFRLAYRILRHREDAEDVTQEAFVRVIRQLPRYRGECALKTWICRIALNACLTAHARRRSPEPLESDAARSPSPGPEAAALGREVERRVRDEALRLNPAHREATLLRLFGELSYEEIAETLGISVNAARLRVHRGMARLRRRLKPWLSEENRP